MGSMMDGQTMCAAPMMIGMAIVATLVVAALALFAAVAVKYLRSGRFRAGPDASSAPRTDAR